MDLKIKNIEQVPNQYALGNQDAKVVLTDRHQTIMVCMQVPFKEWVANGYQIGDTINVEVNWNKIPEEQE